MLIKPLNVKKELDSKKSIDPQIKAEKEKPDSLFQGLLKFSETKKIETQSSPALREFKEEEDKQFTTPDPELYYKREVKTKRI